MNRILCLMLVIIVTLMSGCTVTKTVQMQAKRVTETICSMSPVEREALRNTVDLATFPDRIRVECTSQGN